MRLSRSLLWLALSMVSGCDPGAVSLVVDVRTDLVPGVELARVEVEIPEEGEVQRREVGVEVPARAPFRVAEWAALAPSASRRLTVTAFSMDGRVAARRTALIEHRTSISVQIVLTRSCATRACGASQTCLGEACVDERCLTGEEPECPSDACGACDALSACDDPRCDRGVCLHEADLAACDVGLVCAPAEGCRALVEPDAGPALDAGHDAGPLVGDSGLLDGGLSDGGPSDGGPSDGGPSDGGPVGRDAGASVCRASTGCDLVLQDCPSGSACVPRFIAREVIGRCEAAGEGRDTVCATSAECAPGWDCISARCVEVCCPGAGLTACSVGGATCGTFRGMLAGLCLFDECDVFTQVGCVAGEGCYEVSDGVFSCLAAGTQPSGGPCAAENECEPLLGCGTDLRCTPMCDAALAPCAAGETCIDLGGRELGLCQRGCDPVAQTGCAGLSCYAAGPGDAACFPAGSLPLGAACAVLNECANGAVCAGGTCRRTCVVGMGCVSGSCVAITGWAPWGACI